MGRKVIWDKDKLDEISLLWNQGYTVARLSGLYGVSKPRIYQLLKQAQIGPVTLDSIKSIEEENA